MRTFVYLICALAVALAASGCIKPHRPALSQGNLLNAKEISKVKPGMTREQVIFLIGAPVMAQPFDTNRWDYIYVARRDYEKERKYIVSLFFKNNKVVKIDSDLPEVVEEDELLTNSSDEEDEN